MKIVKPRIPVIISERTDLPFVIDEFRFELEECHFKGQIVTGQIKNRLIFSSTVFEKCNFSESKLVAGRYCDVTFRNCDFSAADFSQSSFTRVEFVDCRLTGINLSATRFNQALFKNCQAKYSVLSQATLSHVLFSDCDLTSIALDDCKWEYIGFENSNLREAELYQTSLKGIDLTTSAIENIRVNGPELRGAIVTSIQAIGLARILGVVIQG